MEQTNTARFFLGANAKTGFSSLYDSFPDGAAGDFLWIIKGGPGSGKSSFMKRIAAAAAQSGQRVETILCSGDPDSLDAVYLPEQRLAYVDGTAPHVIEPRCPGASDCYLDFSRFLDAQALRPCLPELTELNRRYKARYAAAYAQLSAAAALLPRNQPGLYSDAAAQTLARRMEALAARELRALKKPGCVQHRFLSAWSCKGHITLTETLPLYCDRLYLFDNALGLGFAALELLAARAAARGYDAVVCHDPLEPEKIEALLLPEARLAFLASDTPDAAPDLPCRRSRLDALAARELSSEERAALRARKKESRALLSAATETLAQAKALHDELEAVYRPHVDFSGLDALAEEHIRRLNASGWTPAR